MQCRFGDVRDEISLDTGPSESAAYVGLPALCETTAPPSLPPPMRGRVRPITMVTSFVKITAGLSNDKRLDLRQHCKVSW
jgi:hypothetical protein